MICRQVIQGLGFGYNRKQGATERGMELRNSTIWKKRLLDYHREIIMFRKHNLVIITLGLVLLLGCVRPEAPISMEPTVDFTLSQITCTCSNRHPHGINGNSSADPDSYR